MFSSPDYTLGGSPLPESNYNFEEIFDKLKTDGLEKYDFEHASTPPPEVLDESYDLFQSDNDLLKSFLPEISSSNYNTDALGGSSRHEFAPQPLAASPRYAPIPRYEEEEGPSLHDQFSASCSISSAQGGIDATAGNGYASSHPDSVKQSQNWCQSDSLALNSQANWDNAPSAMNQASNYLYPERPYGATSLPSPAESMGSLSNEASSTSSNAEAGSSSIARRQRKAPLGEMTSQERYLRVRKQNNAASREYRDRKKNKLTSAEKMIQELLVQNQHLRECDKKLECQYELCLKVKKMLEERGYACPPE